MDDFPGYATAHGLGGRHGFPALAWRMRTLFRGIPFQGRDVLELGAGEGIMSLWLLHAGARTVISLDPEGDGATEGAWRRAATHRRRLGVRADRWRYLRQTLQRYRPDRRFAAILSHASINHLDEESCIRLRESPEARQRYLGLFAKIRDALEPQGHFVFADSGRVNYWAALGRPSPWAPEIEWHKHQEPEVWCELLQQAGMETVRREWLHPFYRLRTLGPLLETRPAARLLGSSFLVTARRR